MSLGKQSAPPSPNYVGAANVTSQNALNLAQEQQAANNVNQITPYGTTSYANNPQLNQQAYDAAMQQYNVNPSAFGGVPPSQSMFTTPNWTVTQTLTPEQQQILQNKQSLQTGLQGAASLGISGNSGVLANPTVDASQLPSLGIDPGQTYYNAMLTKQAPQIKQMTEQTNQQLANQGIPLGSEAWKLAQSQLGTNLNNLLAQDVTSGMNMGLAANQQGFNQAQQNILNRLAALNTSGNIATGGSQVISPATASATAAQQGQVAPPDLANALQASFNTQLGNINAQNAQTSQGVQTAGTLAALAYMLA